MESGVSQSVAPTCEMCCSHFVAGQSPIHTFGSGGEGGLNKPDLVDCQIGNLTRTMGIMGSSTLHLGFNISSKI